nr:MarR family transcriptional regulator [Amycolatopsis arida]
MVALRRSQGRRRLARMAKERGGPRLDPTLFAVLDAVEEHEEGGCTVGVVAEAMSVDQPRASRLVSRAVTEGLLRRAADQRDGRRTLLELTPTGRRHLDELHAFRRSVFAEAMADWSADDRARFADLLTRFARAYTTLP